MEIGLKNTLMRTRREETFVDCRQVCEKDSVEAVGDFVAEVGKTLISIIMPLTNTLQPSLCVHPVFRFSQLFLACN